MNRRQYLSFLTVAGAGALAGCPSSSDDPNTTRDSPTETETEPAVTATPAEGEPQHKTVVNLRKAGADPTGNESIDHLLARHEGDDTKLVLPEGRYKIDRHVFADLDTFALVGDNATLVPSHHGPGFLFSFRRVSNLVVSGLELDQTGDGALGSLSFRCVGGTNIVRDIAFSGHIDRPERVHGLTVFCEGPETSLTFENIDMSDGARNGTGVYVFPQDDFSDPSREPGELRFRDCQVHGWGGEGIYGSPHAGPISIIGGSYRNNAIQQVRVGGGNDHRALVKDVTIVVEDPPSYATGNMRGIWLEEGTDCLVDSCTVSIRDVGGGGSDGGIVVGSQFGQARITDTTVRTDVDVPGIYVTRPATEFTQSSMPSLDQLPQSWTVSCTDVTIEGTSERGAAVHLYGRENCRFENVRVEQSNGLRHGLLTSDAVVTTIDGGNWVTNGYPMMFGPAEEYSGSTELACFTGRPGMRSREFGGQAIDIQQPSDDGKLWIPASEVPSREADSRIPYLGITGTNSGVPRGQSILATWNGGNIVRR